MPRCCGGATCSCVLEEGPHVQIVGTGSPSDPFLITADVALQAKDNTVFDVVITGLGTAALPWEAEVKFASTAKLDSLPDVNAPAPTNAQVLGFDTATGMWTPRAPTTAAAGSVQHDTALTGDGSAGTPLGVNEDPARMLGTTAAGLGLNDTGMRRIVRHFTDATARSSMTPTPDLNTLTMLDDTPGKIDYWTGSAWEAAGMFLLALTGQEFWQASGPYTGTQRITLMVRNVAQITDTGGVFDAIPATDLAGRAGVLTAIAQATNPSGGTIATPFSVVLSPGSGAIKGTAYRLDDGQPVAASSINCTVFALVY